MNYSASAGRHQIIKDSSQYLAATIVAQGVGLVRGIVIPVLFSPAQLGVWNLMGVILTYGGNAHVGLLHGMNKAIPLLRGQGKVEEADTIRDNVFWLNLLLGALAGSVLWFVSLMVPTGYVSGLRVIAGATFLQLIFFYLYSLLRADSRFGLVSQGVTVLSILSTGLVVVLAFAFDDHLFGALIGLTGAYLVVVAYWFSKGRYRFILRLSWNPVRGALVIGFPLIVLGLLDTVFMSIDRWLIAANLGAMALGYYALGIMASNLLSLVPGSIASVLYPRMLERYGAFGDPVAARGLLLGPLRAIAALTLVLLCGTAICLPLLIHLFLPKYLASVPIIEILLPGAFFLSISSIAGNYMVAINKQKWLMIVQVIVIVFTLLVDNILLKAGYGVIGIALGTSAGYFIFGLCYTVLAVHLAIGQKAETVRFLARLSFPFVIAVSAMIATGIFVWEGLRPDESVLLTAMRLALVMSVLLTALWFVNRDGELATIAGSELRTWLASRRG